MYIYAGDIPQCMWRSENQLVRIIFLLLPCEFQGLNQTIGLGGKCLSSLSNLAGPIPPILIFSPWKPSFYHMNTLVTNSMSSIDWFLCNFFAFFSALNAFLLLSYMSKCSSQQASFTDAPSLGTPTLLPSKHGEFHYVATTTNKTEGFYQIPLFFLFSVFLQKFLLTWHSQLHFLLFSPFHSPL